jgi:hypothetical protein
VRPKEQEMKTGREDKSEDVEGRGRKNGRKMGR